MIKREKRRYLAVNVETVQPVDEQTVLDAVYGSVVMLFGEVGASQTNLRMIKFVVEKNQFVIQCSHKMLEPVRAAVAFTVLVGGNRAALHVVNVSGTLKALAGKTA
ncbi:MAG: Rpp14/Pop5 family protein [Candidatus Bathyarchaeia archaeon]